ncbi:PREDICTED: uncharacterized protein LOC105556222 [Vollenhovia emeryi]|uniref:uncharacterized protein LOC105556222 n=1 Tax=Vollenhovia emeryi TaxID=411798 RepID=UPI0005F3E43A|nr:PREDICTED: uncharacterized protein LOC105556222 [Vollenhovia emeryi]
MEAAKRKRTTNRTAFTRAAGDLAKALENAVDKDEITVRLQLLEEKHDQLQAANKVLLACMHEAEDVSETAIADEDASHDEYTRKFLRARLTARNALEMTNMAAATTSVSVTDGAPEMTNMAAATGVSVTDGVGTPVRYQAPALTNQIKLPKIELKKYDGDIKEWLRFWSQFKKIHENAAMDKGTKFEYLLQAIVPDSRAAELVGSFPPTEENYDKVIDAIKNRFGRDEILVEVYVRELLKLILQNALKPNEKMKLSSLFDKIESQLRALESLGVTTDKCGAMLFPLVESSLPEELLCAWQRNQAPSSRGSGTSPKENRLTQLMKFLQSEVENEERITMAVSGFDLNERKQSKHKQRAESHKDTPSAMSLHARGKVSKSTVCVFCDDEHASSKCEKARKMALNDRKSVLQTKKACFNCLKIGHSSRICRGNIKCALCDRRHFVLMCPEVVSDHSTPPSNEAVKDEKTLLNRTRGPEVILQTVHAIIRNQQAEKIVRVFFDSGSTRSYVCKDLVHDMKYEPIGALRLKQSLFGNMSSEIKDHKKYLVHLRSLDGNYACNFKAYDEEKICAEVPLWDELPRMNELKELDIQLTDGPGESVHAQPIKILIGADIAGKLMTGRTQQLKCGLTAIETHLGWTLMGETPNASSERLAVQTTSMLQRETCISDLWNLDVIDIKDPVVEKARRDHDDQVRKWFVETITTNEEGRYSVCLPWIQSHPALPSNRDLAEKRLVTTAKKLKATRMYTAYNRIFNEWREEGIIELVPINEIETRGHYLPHRGVVKEGSSTPFRPVFDASAKDKDSPSLNECLETGPNLIELITSLLLRFRKRKFGITADIRKAFLQISLSRNDRDFLRFLWYDDYGKINVYRHTRVVFGATCSPFILGAVIDFHLKNLLSDEKRKVCMTDATGNIPQLMESFYVDNCVTSVDTMEEVNGFMSDARYAMREGAFDLRGWEHTGSKTGEGEISVLGMIWNKRTDTLHLTIPPIESVLNGKITKRVIVSVAHRIFDPLGLICPVMICPKLLLQQTWISRAKWDEELSEEIQKEFKSWLNNLSSLKELKIPRWAFCSSDPGAEISFHVFCDASKKAYAAVMYARMEYDSQVNVVTVDFL